MKNMPMAIVGALFLSCLVIVSTPQSGAQSRQERPPEYKELMSAVRIEDLKVRIQELERIRAAYPQSPYLPAIENAITTARIGLATDVDSIVELQKPALAAGRGAGRVYAYYRASMEILRHKNLLLFDKKKVTEAVNRYVAEGLRLSSDPEFIKTVPPDQRDYVKSNTPTLYLPQALALLNEGATEKALAAVENYEKNGGMVEKTYHYVRASVMGALGKNQEALESFLEAAAENFEDAAEKAKEYWLKVHGSDSGFVARLEAVQRELPFRPEPFQPGPNWKGKTVLAELFTGSECPPCVGADLAFDGLIESYGREYLAVLEYHLPIPGPDPMMNAASQRRARFYGVNSTPTVVFDGTERRVGGGSRQMAGEKYNEFAALVNAKIAAQPDVRLKASAELSGDEVRIRFSTDKDLLGVDYQFALVQAEEKYRGGNGIVFHKMVVRDFATLDREKAREKKFRFRISQAEKDAEASLLEHEKDNNVTFKEKHSAIDRSRLYVVFFLQDGLTKNVLNSVVAEVAK